MKHRARKLLGIMLCVAMVIGLVPGVSLTALAWDGNPYARLKNTTTVVKFDNKDWYLIEDNSIGIGYGTVTLLAKECVGASKYNTNGTSTTYSGSTVETYVNTWYTDNISADAKIAVRDNKLFLLTVEQAKATTYDVRKCSQASGANANLWWLCSPGLGDTHTTCVDGLYGNVDEYGPSAFFFTLGVRPALELNLQFVFFSSESNEFTLKPAATITIAPKPKMLTYNGSLQDLVTAGVASGGIMVYALGTETAANGLYFGDLIPNAAEAGIYYVWYWAKADGNHINSAADYVIVPISGAEETEEEPEPEKEPEKELDQVLRNAINYVSRCYRMILGREPDEAGLKDWVASMLKGRAGALQVVEGFFSSDEFKKLGLTNEQIVKVLYRVMLDRTVDATGKAEWVAVLDSGSSVSTVIQGIGGSAEFIETSKKLGVRPGVSAAAAKNAEAGLNADVFKVRELVTRFYQVFLGRDPDPEGLDAWTQALCNGATATQVISGFINSPEFKNMNLSNEQKVEALYRSMLGRASDPGGKADWVAVLNAGYPIETIVNGFAGSPEFTGICNACGIVAGRLDAPNVNVPAPGPVSEYTNPEKVQAFVEHTYEAVLGRGGDPEGITNHTSLILQGRLAPQQLIHDFLFSAEFTTRGLNNEEFIKTLYRAYLYREADPAGLAEWVALLDGGGASGETVIIGFANSNEFKAILNGLK